MKKEKLVSKEALWHQAEEMALLHEAGNLLARTLDPDVIYDTMQQIIARAMDCDALVVSTYDPDDNLIRCAYAWIEGRHTDVSRFPALALAPEGRGMQSRVIRTGQPLVIQDAKAESQQQCNAAFYANPDGTVDDRPDPNARQTGSILIVPIRLEGRVLGAVQVSSLNRSAYTDAHLRLLDALLTQVAAASRNAYLYQQAKAEIAERRRVERENARLLRAVRRTALRHRAFLREVLASVTEGKLHLCERPRDLPPKLREPAGAPLALSAPALRVLRERARQAAEACGLDTERRQDLLTAVGEAAMNAVVHAGGGTARLFADPDGGTVQVRVQDRGGGIDMSNLHRATLERGWTTVGTLGHGFWMMLRTADRVWLLTGPKGTTVVIEQDRVPPEPAWLRERACGETAGSA